MQQIDCSRCTCPGGGKNIGSEEAIRYAAVDATNYKTLEAPLTGTTAPLVITTEGLLMYLTQPELEEVSMYFWELTVSEKSWRSLASISSC